MPISRLKMIMDKAIPLQAKALLAGGSSLMGCTSPMAAPTDTTEAPAPRPAFRQGEQVCYGDDADAKWITLLEDVGPRSQAVLAAKPDGKRFYATVDYFLTSDKCRLK